MLIGLRPKTLFWTEQFISTFPEHFAWMEEYWTISGTIVFSFLFSSKTMLWQFFFYYEGLFPQHFKVAEFIVSENLLANQPKQWNSNCPKQPKSSNEQTFGELQTEPLNLSHSPRQHLLGIKWERDLAVILLIWSEKLVRDLSPSWISWFGCLHRSNRKDNCPPLHFVSYKQSLE